MPGRNDGPGLVKLGNLYPPRAGGKSVMNGTVQFGPFKFRVVITNNKYYKDPTKDAPWTLFAQAVDLTQSQGSSAPATPQPGGFPAPQAPSPQAPAPAQDPVDRAAGVPPGGEYPESWE